MRLSNLLLIALLFVQPTAMLGQKLANPILLWPEGAPGATGSTDEDKPTIIPFIPEAAKRNGAAILVVPGGGFTIRAVDHEGVLVAQWLKEQGFTAFLLRYRLKPIYGREDWVKDGQRAMQYIRSQAPTYQISSNRIGAVGFSAGANLIGDMAFQGLQGKNDASDPLDRYAAKPDFIIMAYGSFQLPPNSDPMKTANLPPTFLYGTAEDEGATKGMLELYASLFKAKVPVEAHFFQNGVHGSGFAIGDPILGEWPKLMKTWLATLGFLTDKKQCSITGVVQLDGAPLLRGMIILTSVDNANAPPVVVYMTNTGTGELGRFANPQSHGPVEGNYRIEVRQEATRWTSNSRDPFMIKMMKKQSDNTLTENDIKEWSAFLRKRDLSPSIENQRIFSRQHPNDQRDYVVKIKDGVDLKIEVFSK
jgi:acetyl esterase/lipase